MSEKKTIGPWMKTNVVMIESTATLLQAAKLLTEKRVGTLPVTDKKGKMVGLTSMRAIVEMFLPDFLALLGNVDFVKDFGALRELSQEDIEKADSLTVAEFMGEPVEVDESCSLVRALSIMSKHRMPDLTVTRDGKPVGIVSRVDVGRAFLENWLSEEQMAP